MKWNELRRIAEERGWRLFKHGARHDLYRHPEHPELGILTIGRHGSEEVKNGTCNKIRKQIGF